MVMLCLQTSCHRCPSALHNRLVTSTPSLSPLSLIHHVRVDASSIAEAPELAGRANRGRRAKNAGVATGRAAAAGGMLMEEKRVVDHGGSGARGDGVLARSRADRRRAKNEPTPPVRRRRDPRVCTSLRIRRGVRFSRNRDFTPRRPRPRPSSE